MIRRFSFLVLFAAFFFIYASGQNFDKNAVAVRVGEKPDINGKLDDSVWSFARETHSFTQYDPKHGENPSFKTVVRFLYDDEALYVGAVMHDSYPDSILTELGERDNTPNADRFEIKLDTYLQQQDAYVFAVSASGVQRDYRQRDWSYDAVWQSAVDISEKGWSVEMKIPYSAFRFPDKEKQTWGLQIIRNIRRSREQIVWAFMEKGLPDYMNYWGVLTGIKDVKPPIRLALKPYLSGHTQTAPDDDENIVKSHSFGGGLDLQYGINESYTADVTLLPDFSQVKSDNTVKNLSAFETVHSERRPFFTESMDLFKKGGLFYTRRIGQQPRGYHEVEDNIPQDAQVTENPAEAELVNAIKIYGRNNNGTGMGMLNAITGDTYATYQTDEGTKKQYLTEPFTNYNILVFDKPLKNNSDFYLINTNTYRKGDYDKANVTGAGTTLKDENNDFSIEARGALSQRFESAEASSDNVDIGFQYYMALRKISGNFRLRLFRDVKDDQFDINDMGVNHRNNFQNNGIRFDYRKYEPFSIFRYFNNYLALNKSEDYTTHENIDFKVKYGGYATLKSYTSVWYQMNYSMAPRYDYYDPRAEDRYIVRPPYFNSSVGLSTDYRKPVALNSKLYLAFDEEEYQMASLNLSPRIRFNDYFSVDYNFKLARQFNSIGYVTSQNEDIIYGNRDLSTYENSISSKLMLNNELSVNFWMRHYWYLGEYNEYYSLTENGNLNENPVYEEPNDFNFNAFNLDLILNWQFAPGSNMSLVWKNEVTTENSEIIRDAVKNFENAFNAPHTNTLSLKIKYHLDYQNLNLFKQNS
ncbi:MAG: DUF5916 domain-containing protein [Bacteroidota bacterium]